MNWTITWANILWPVYWSPSMAASMSACSVQTPHTFSQNERTNEREATTTKKGSTDFLFRGSSIFICCLHQELSRFALCVFTYKKVVAGFVQPLQNVPLKNF